MKKAPSLLKKPNLIESYDRERWIQEAFDRNGSESAREARQSIVARLTHYTKKVHGIIPEEVFEWMKKESKKDLEILTGYAVNFLAQYVKFCKEDHRDILVNRGRNTKSKIPNKKNYLHKLHDNSITIQIARSRVFMSQVPMITQWTRELFLAILIILIYQIKISYSINFINSNKFMIDVT